LILSILFFNNNYGFSVQVSGFWSLATGCWPKVRNEKPAAKMLKSACGATTAARNKDLTPETRHLKPGLLCYLVLGTWNLYFLICKKGRHESEKTNFKRYAPNRAATSGQFTRCPGKLGQTAG
jgi:hypothetical protein